MIKTIFNIVVLIFFLLLMLFNMDQKVDVVLFAKLAKQVPLSMVMVVSFMLGLISMFPAFISYKIKLKRKLEGESEKKLKNASKKVNEKLHRNE